MIRALTLLLVFLSLASCSSGEASRDETSTAGNSPNRSSPSNQLDTVEICAETVTGPDALIPQLISVYEETHGYTSDKGASAAEFASLFQEVASRTRDVTLKLQLDKIVEGLSEVGQSRKDGRDPQSSVHEDGLQILASRCSYVDPDRARAVFNDVITVMLDDE